jgi:hypothetical protein
MAKIKAVFGIYKSRERLESAVNGYKDAGFPISDISVVLASVGASNQGAATKDSSRKPKNLISSPKPHPARHLPGWLEQATEVELRGIGSVTAAGPLAARLAASGDARTMGGFIELLSALGMTQSEARHYQTRLLQGEILVAIHVESAEEIRRAKEIMEITRAEHIVADPGQIAGRKTAA